MFSEYLGGCCLHATLQQAFDMIRRLCNLCHAVKVNLHTIGTKQASLTVQNRSFRSATRRAGLACRTAPLALTAAVKLTVKSDRLR